MRVVPSSLKRKPLPVAVTVQRTPLRRIGHLDTVAAPVKLAGAVN
jgi:hypothetical protein